MDTKLLELLVCPVTKGHLDYDREKQELVSRSARLRSEEHTSELQSR